MGCTLEGSFHQLSSTGVFSKFGVKMECIVGRQHVSRLLSSTEEEGIIYIIEGIHTCLGVSVSSTLRRITRCSLSIW